MLEFMIKHVSSWKRLFFIHKQNINLEMHVNQYNLEIYEILLAKKYGV